MDRGGIKWAAITAAGLMPDRFVFLPVFEQGATHV
jgi:hypothetical protein